MRGYDERELSCLSPAVREQLLAAVEAGEVSVDVSLFGGLSLPEPWLAWLPPQAVAGVRAALQPLMGEVGFAAGEAGVGACSSRCRGGL